MKKITLFIMLLGIMSITAQNRSAAKEMERALMARGVHPITHHFDNLRSDTRVSYLNESFDNGIPDTWTVIDNIGGAVWTGVADYNGESLDGTPFAMADSDGAGSGVDTDTELISPEIDVANATALTLSFDQYFNTYSGADVADVDVYDGTQWVNVYTTSEDVGGWGAPDHQAIDVTAFANANFKVRFHYYNANWEWYWSIDNFNLYEPEANDLAVVDLSPGTFQANTEFFPSATVFNNGSNTQNDFDVTFNIMDSSEAVVYTETVNVTGANLVSGESFTVMPTTASSLETGSYMMEAVVTLADDGDNGNDSYYAGLEILDYFNSYASGTVYGYVAWDGDESGDANNLVTMDAGTGDVTPIGVVNSSEFIIGGTFVGGILLGLEYSTNAIYFIDGNGNAYKYASIKGDANGDVLTGIAFDAGLNKLYVCGTTKLYEVTDPFFNTAYVGDMYNGGEVMIGIDFDNNGNLYGIDLGDDSLYSIDTTTGAATSIGPLGVDLNYAQDMGANPVTGDLYGTLYTGESGGLYTIDKMSGAATPVGTITGDEYTVCAIFGDPTAIANNEIEGLEVYPNPTNGMVYLNAQENILHISITDMTGKEVMSVDNSGLQAQINISGLATGHYIMKITTDKTVATQQIIKR